MVKDQEGDKITQGVNEQMKEQGGRPPVRRGLWNYGGKGRYEREREGEQRAVSQLLGQKWLQGPANRIQ